MWVSVNVSLVLLSLSPSITDALSKLAFEPLHMLELSLEEGGEGNEFPESVDI